VTGSELVGLVPKKVLTDAGKYFLEKQRRSAGISDEELIDIAVKTLGLSELSPFDPKKKIIEYQMDDAAASPLIQKNLREFAAVTASESPAPGGGSVAAYVGTLGISLATMVANLSAHKKGWEAQWKTFSAIAEKGQQLKDELLRMVDEDTRAFNGIMEAFAMPKNTQEEKNARTAQIQMATKTAIEIPLKVMELCFSTFDIIEEMVKNGNPNSVTDAGVGALCARAAVHGAYLNVKINSSGLKDESYVEKTLKSASEIIAQTDLREKQILQLVDERM
jgi:glutamate formiminotransferase/formiminotetrahydrofolate cyclodeaminase